MPKKSMIMFFLCTLGLMEIALPQVQKERERKVRADKQQFQEQDFWIYDNLEVAFDVAAEQQKPLLVVFRCIP
ncbi:MAG: thioredoxin family protein [Pirellulaceae bacterium]|nr:thioredoxin family protein [Pirellulaceae bacterium]